MRDDRNRWPPAQHTTQAARVFDGVELSLWEPTAIFMVTAPAFFLDQQLRPLAWPEAAKLERLQRPAAGRLALRLRRDRALVLEGSGGGSGLQTGLREAGRVLVTDMSGGYVFARLDGPLALSLLQTGCALDPGQPSASVLRLWHGFEAMICPVAGAQAFLIGVEAPWFDALWSRLLSEAQTA